ncbi:MAG TPA: hypothetical protein PKD85_10950, partial [Saprospiraceae bacterium]|nr:hypothetical protein [Saprospiraceae bacterium]
AYRDHIYTSGFSGDTTPIVLQDLKIFNEIVLKYLEQTIDSNRRADNMYHAYNILKIGHDSFSIERLDEMLEGQVAVLSSGYLNAEQSLQLLDAMRNSKLYRADQNSYLLYPNKDLPNFFEKNNISKDQIATSTLLTQMIEDRNEQIVLKDEDGNYHFNGNFKNAYDLLRGLQSLENSKYALLTSKDKHQIVNIWEGIFNHSAFTGRSGTFYGYEGLGSIYWHMVSKLHLAVQEVCIKNSDDASGVFTKLIAHFEAIYQGIGVHKSPSLYGAFPTDPYSHTPAHRGAQQPGMTGQVKEDILVKINEFGTRMINGSICIKPQMLRHKDFIEEPTIFEFTDVNGHDQEFQMPAKSIGITYCQVPFIYTVSDADFMEVIFTEGNSEKILGHSLDQPTSQKILLRNGEIKAVHVYIHPNNLFQN